MCVCLVDCKNMEYNQPLGLSRFASAERLFFDPKLPQEGLITQIQGIRNSQTAPTADTIKSGPGEDERHKRRWLRQLVASDLHDKGFGTALRSRRDAHEQHKGRHAPASPQEDMSNAYLDVTNYPPPTRSKSIHSPPRKSDSRRRSKLYGSNPVINADRRRSSLAPGLARRQSTFGSMPAHINIRSLHLTAKDLELLGRGELKRPSVSGPPNIVSGDDALTPGDDDEVARQRRRDVEQRGAEQLHQNWLLDEQLKEEMRKFQRLQNKLAIRDTGPYRAFAAALWCLFINATVLGVAVAHCSGVL